MPELPEVETTRRGIEPHIVGRTIKNTLIRQPNLRWPIPDDLPELLNGKLIQRVRRRAKYLLIDIADGSLVVHLGMSGSLRIVTADEPPRFHDHVDIVLSRNTVLRYHDPRRFGSLLWQPLPGETIQQLSNLGPEPLSDEFDGERLYALSRGRTAAVKTFIMDNATVVGVGNIYASEALFTARIHPARAAGRISRKRYQVLAEAIKEVLANAIEMGGTTLRDFVGSDGQPGYFKQSLHVYGRAGEPCTVCKRPLHELRLGQRSSVFCGHCQH